MEHFYPSELDIFDMHFTGTTTVQQNWTYVPTFLEHTHADDYKFNIHMIS
jgi:hypothetical protein